MVPGRAALDLRFLAQILKQAEREKYIGRSPFDLGRFFANEYRDRRKPHILTLDEEKRLLAIARPRIRALIVLGVQTGMRTGEMLSLRWEHIDFLNNCLRVERSKTRAGIRNVLSNLQIRVAQVAQSHWPRIFRLGVPEFLKSAAPATRRS